MLSPLLRSLRIHHIGLQGMVASALLAFILLVVSAVGAQTFEEASAAYNRGDYAVAYESFRTLAEQGVADAQAFLGFMYAQGRGVPQDDAEAVRWHHQAAEQGHALAQAKLGAMYAMGRGVSQDYVQAHKWFNLAASRLSSSEQEFRDTAVQARNEVASKMTPAQIAEAQRLMREWQPGQR